MKKSFILGIFLVSSMVTGFSQSKEVNQETQFWTQYSLLGRISSKWSVYADFVDRFNKFFDSQNSIFIRPAIVYDLSDNASVYAGYCNVTYFPDDHSPVNLTEHRPWQQLLINSKLGKFSFQHRYRLEERFNQVYENGARKDDYTFTWRFRYKLNVQYPIWKGKEGDKSLSILLTNELLTNFGKNVVVSYFNSNRLFLGVSIQFSKGLNASVGFTDIFKSTNSAGHYVNINAPTINITHKLDFRKNKGI